MRKSLKVVCVLMSLSFVSCATQFKESVKGADGQYRSFGYRIEPVFDMAPFTNYAAFMGNSETTAPQAVAYTKMAALIHCTEQGLYLMIDSNVKDVRSETKVTSKRVYTNGDMSAPQKLQNASYQSFMVLFGCSKKNSATKMTERRSIVSEFCQVRGSVGAKYCSGKSKYRQ